MRIIRINLISATWTSRIKLFESSLFEFFEYMRSELYVANSITHSSMIRLPIKFSILEKHATQIFKLF